MQIKLFGSLVLIQKTHQNTLFDILVLNIKYITKMVAWFELFSFDFDLMVGHVSILYERKHALIQPIDKTNNTNQSECCMACKNDWNYPKITKRNTKNKCMQHFRQVIKLWVFNTTINRIGQYKVVKAKLPNAVSRFGLPSRDAADTCNIVSKTVTKPTTGNTKQDKFFQPLLIANPIMVGESHPYYFWHSSAITT